MSHKRRNSPSATSVLDALNTLKMPDLGDPLKIYKTDLTEPEISSIHAIVAYVDTQVAHFMTDAGPGSKLKWWEHYGPVLRALSERLKRDYDRE